MGFAPDDRDGRRVGGRRVQAAMLTSSLFGGIPLLAAIEAAGAGGMYIDDQTIGAEPAIAAIQVALVALGYELPVHGVDGEWGSETGAAIVDFKTVHSLSDTLPTAGFGTVTHLDAEVSYLEGRYDNALGTTNVALLARDPLTAAVVDAVRGAPALEQAVIDFLELGNRFCFPMSAVIGAQAAAVAGRLAEGPIFADYCSVSGPCGPDDFLDSSPSPTPYYAFLRSHNPIGTVAAMAVAVSVRPDIMSHRPTGAVPEYYEIKPFSPSGVRAGIEKLARLSIEYTLTGLPYVPGTAYTPTPEILLHRFVTDANETLEVYLWVRRPLPGLLLYRYCIGGDYALYFNRVRVIAGCLAILVALAPEILVAAEAAGVVTAIGEVAAAFGLTLPVLTAI